jgi:hypothetical protein
VKRNTVNTAAALCVIRDAVDMVPILCGHYLRLGFGRVAFVDDGSTDGTSEALAQIAAKTRRVAVTRVRQDRFRQAELATAAANDLIDDGHRFVLPFDSDELWHLSGSGLRDLARRRAPAQVVGKQTNFVQCRSVSTARRFSLLSVRYRVRDGIKANRKAVLNFEMPWVVRGGTKLGFWSNEHVALGKGFTASRGAQLTSSKNTSRFSISRCGASTN